jgi:hypothetical protein
VRPTVLWWLVVFKCLLLGQRQRQLSQHQLCRGRGDTSQIFYRRILAKTANDIRVSMPKASDRGELKIRVSVVNLIDRAALVALPEKCT